MTAVVFDIETSRNSRAESIISQIQLKPDARLTDPVKIEASLEQKRKTLMDKAALSWWNGAVVQISAEVLSSTESYSENIGSTGDEKTLLESFFHWLHLVDASQLLGANIEKFDIPYLTGRAMVHKVKRHTLIDKRVRSMDLYRILGNPRYSSQCTSLDTMAIGLGLKPKIMDSSLIPQLALEGQWDKIKEHCDQDVAITAEIFERFIGE